MDDTPLKILVHGASGRMGRALLRLIAADEALQLAVAVTGSGTHELAHDRNGVEQLAASRLAEAPEFDVAVDFSLPDGFDALLALCRERGRPLVSGTTGLSNVQLEAIARAGQEIAVLWSANFSVGVTVLAELVRRASAALPGWDCDIVESHHVKKLDAPSGTALMLGASVEAGRGTPPAYASLRAGDIVGEHLVQIAGTGERLELVHRATDRDIFARGALRAARWLSGQTPGCYAMKDCLGLE
jgi:4-hydroxy-tetrahydrodipicolinate reductase